MTLDAALSAAPPLPTARSSAASLGQTVAVARALALWSGQAAYVCRPHPASARYLIALADDLRPADAPGACRVWPCASVTPDGRVTERDPRREALAVDSRLAGAPMG